jgi:hypothetical protein
LNGDGASPVTSGRRRQASPRALAKREHVYDFQQAWNYLVRKLGL